MMKEVGMRFLSLFFPIFYNFLPFALFLLVWYSLISFSALTLSSGSHELSLVGYPFHLIR
jgi:hypothetical protein